MTHFEICSLICSSLRRRESLVAEGFGRMFPEKGQTLVYRQPDLAGMERLEKFGRRLYQPAVPEPAGPELVAAELVGLGGGVR